MPNRIYWTQDERTTVLKGVAKAMQTHSFERGELGRLLREAQASILPAYRRRSFTAGRIGPDLHKLEAQAQKFYQELQVERLAKATAPEPEEQHTAEAVDTIETRLEDLGRTLAATMMAAFGDELLVAIRQTLREAVAEIPPPPIPGREDRPTPQRVLVIGTKREWHAQLRKEFAGRLNISFFDNPNGSSGLASACKRSEAVILNGSMSRHSHQSVARASGKPLSIVHGAFSNLRTALVELNNRRGLAQGEMT